MEKDLPDGKLKKREDLRPSLDFYWRGCTHDETYSSIAMKLNRQLEIGMQSDQAEGFKRT